MYLQCILIGNCRILLSTDVYWDILATFVQPLKFYLLIKPFTYTGIYSCLFYTRTLWPRKRIKARGGVHAINLRSKLSRAICGFNRTCISRVLRYDCTGYAELLPQDVHWVIPRLFVYRVWNCSRLLILVLISIYIAVIKMHVLTTRIFKIKTGQVRVRYAFRGLRPPPPLQTN